MSHFFKSVENHRILMSNRCNLSDLVMVIIGDYGVVTVHNS